MADSAEKNAPPLGRLEETALRALVAWSGADDGWDQGSGWHVHEWPIGLPYGSLTFDQFRAALVRLREKGLVSSHVWHPGQGAGAAREWLWYPTNAGKARVIPLPGVGDSDGSET